MASDLQWDHHFCLTCDKQTDGATYCSESCRLADYEEASSFSLPSSGPNSPTWAPSGISTYPWINGATSSYNRKLFSLSPAYDFSNAQPYGSTPHYSQNYNIYQSRQQHSSGLRRSVPTAASMYSSASTSTLSLPPTSSTSTATTNSVTYQHALSPSSSHSSLSSMRSGMSAGGAIGALAAFANGSSGNLYQPSYGSPSTSVDLSEKVRSELRKYASSLEQGKLQRNLQRRRSC